MGKFRTLDIHIQENPKLGNYTIHNRYGIQKGSLTSRVEVTGTWRSRPKGKRLFTDAKIRQIRKLHAKGETMSFIASKYECSVPLVSQIVYRSIYRDVI